MWSHKMYNVIWKTQQMSKYRKMIISVTGMCYAKLKPSDRTDAVWGIRETFRLSNQRRGDTEVEVFIKNWRQPCEDLGAKHFRWSEHQEGMSLVS